MKIFLLVMLFQMVVLRLVRRLSFPAFFQWPEKLRILFGC